MNLGTNLARVSTGLLISQREYLAGFVEPTRAQLALLQKIRNEISSRRVAARLNARLGGK